MPLYLKDESICADWTYLKSRMNVKRDPLYIYFLNNQFLPLLVSTEKLEEGEVISGEVEYGEFILDGEKVFYLTLIKKD
jgi:hypothetical protein